MRTLLIDADALVYETAYANQSSTQWDADTFTLTANLDAAQRQLDDDVARIQGNLKGDRVVMCLSDYTDPWRKAIMPDDYKVKRAAAQRPLLFKPLREYIHEKYETFQRPTLEADDVLGILLTNRAIIPGEKIVVSNDKDMKTLPGLHCTIKEGRKPKPPVFTISEAEADYHHFFQTLTGDRVDEYPGCPGIGAVKAEKILSAFKSGNTFDARTAWRVGVLLAFRKAGKDEAFALMNARVARICRNSDYDFKNKRVILWQPPR